MKLSPRAKSDAFHEAKRVDSSNSLSDKGANGVGKLARGTFYFGSGPDKPRKITTSLCLSYHPSTPPSEAQVLELARQSRPSLP